MPVSQSPTSEEKTRITSKKFFYLLAGLLFIILLTGVFFFLRRQNQQSAELLELEESVGQDVTTVDHPSLRLVAEEGGLGFPLFFDHKNELYSFHVVCGQTLKLDEPIKISPGIFVGMVIRAYYLDASNQVQQINLPYFTYDTKNFVHHVLGMGFGQKDSLSDLLDDVEMAEGWYQNGKGPLVIEDRSDFDYGQIFFIGFGVDRSQSAITLQAQKFYGAAIPAMHNKEDLEAFARTGDSSYLPTLEGVGPILIPLKDSAGGVLHEMQQDSR